VVADSQENCFFFGEVGENNPDFVVYIKAIIAGEMAGEFVNL